jgi:hypothetical protein
MGSFPGPGRARCPGEIISRRWIMVPPEEEVDFKAGAGLGALRPNAATSGRRTDDRRGPASRLPADEEHFA